MYALKEDGTVLEGILINKKKGSTSTYMAICTVLHNIEITLQNAGQLVTAMGVVAKLIGKTEKSTTLKLHFRGGSFDILKLLDSSEPSREYWAQTKKVLIELDLNVD